jgi:asparagine synthase (glutamine-hydrolysing)
LEAAKASAKEFGLKLETVSIKAKDLPKLISKIVPIINSTNPVDVGVALPLFIACEKAKKQGLKVVFSGQGADELFYGYARFKKSKNLKKDSLDALQNFKKEGLGWNKAIAESNGLRLVLPYLDLAVEKFAQTLPEKLKLNSERNKVVLRELATQLGAPVGFTERKKTAAQYGSNFDKAINKLAKKQGLGKSEFLSRQGGEKIAALFSGGKDSCLAIWRMQEQGFEVNCLISMLPKTFDSFMYHKPDLKILRLHSKTLGIPLLLKKTEGEKEKELLELEEVLAEAKKKFGVKGVVCGALYSNYQSERVQKICDKLNLKLFSPLWHMGQETELQELVDRGFEFILTKVAAMGMSSQWLGKTIGKKEIAELEALNEKVGFNVAGEGGEFESLVLNAPNFEKKLVVEQAEKVMQNEFTGSLKIKKISLKAKKA